MIFLDVILLNYTESNSKIIKKAIEMTIKE